MDNILPPSIPETCREAFLRGAVALNPEEIPGLLKEICEYHERIKQAAAANPDIHLAMIDSMVLALKQLLATYADLPVDKRSLAIGAARYFLNTHDAHDDLTDPLGFDDDLAVINTVLITLGREDLLATRS